MAQTHFISVHPFFQRYLHAIYLARMAEGMIRKMRTTLDGTVRYAMRLGDEDVPMEAFIGKPFRLASLGKITCINCGRSIKKTYGQGFCFPCFRDSPNNSECIIRPELCRGHLGEGRDPDWEKEHHVQEHVVYLSHTGGIKVGVTRATQVPTRWIDQGATLAVAIARVPYRQLAGAIEVDLKRTLADKTNYRKMLTGPAVPAEVLEEARSKVQGDLDPALHEYLVEEEVLELEYPMHSPPPKIKSVTLEKVPEIQGNFAGIKGQYLIWGDGRVMNVRNHSGHHVVIEGT